MKSSLVLLLAMLTIMGHMIQATTTDDGTSVTDPYSTDDGTTDETTDDMTSAGTDDTNEATAKKVVIYDSQKPLNGFGDPFTNSLARIINIFLNLGISTGTGAGGFYGIIGTNVMNDITDSLNAIKDIITNPPLSADALATAAENTARLLKDLLDIFTQMANADVPIEAVPLLPMAKLPLMFGIPIVELLANFLHAFAQSLKVLPFGK